MIFTIYVGENLLFLKLFKFMINIIFLKSSTSGEVYKNEKRGENTFSPRF